MFDESRNPPPLNVVDRFIRQFHFTAYLAAILILYLVGATVFGMALVPALLFLSHWAPWSLGLGGAIRWLVLGVGFGVAFFLFGFTLLLVVPLYNLLLPTHIKPFKGGYYTIAALPWYIHNGLFYLVRFTFLPYVTVTPFGIWFLKAMGMKIGRRVFITTEYISDPQLITLGDDAVLGGSVRIFAHYGGAGNLVIAPVVVGAGVTVGLNATVMGDVLIGPGATILPHSVLLPGSRVGAGETWGGVPARPISREEMDRIKQEIRGEQSAPPAPAAPRPPEPPPNSQ